MSHLIFRKPPFISIGERQEGPMEQSSEAALVVLQRRESASSQSRRMLHEPPMSAFGFLGWSYSNPFKGATNTMKALYERVFL